MANADGLRVEPLDRAIGLGHMPELVELVSQVVASGAQIGFLGSVTYNRARDYWRDVFAIARDEKRALAAAWHGDRIVGAVQLNVETPDNGRHRASVEKLMVAPTYQGRGLGRALLRTVEAMAVQRRRSLLTLDCVAGSVAEALYVSEGWQLAGEIPDYAVDPDGVTARAARFYWKAVA